AEPAEAVEGRGVAQGRLAAARGGRALAGSGRGQPGRAGASARLSEARVTAAEVVRPATVRRDRPRLGRNDPCHCGSGKKYKNCHMRQDDAGAAADRSS
ncbi:MAG: SEC-C metal-binding domain-containing protein, partial [Myxococcota bacterium]|nr:SEC-C metal-binding domain-containing protein [Myxococcota bacterium]